MTNSNTNPNLRWWDLPAIFLLLVVLTTAFTRLAATGWTSNLEITRTITYLGLIAGLALGSSRFSPRLSTFFALVYGVFVVTWRVGLTLGEGIPWQERLISLAGRLNLIFINLIQRKSVPDSLLFLVLMGFVFWALSVHAGFSLTRSAHPWIVILPTGIVLVFIHSYDDYIKSRVGYLVVYLLFSLLLIARLVYVQNKHRWEQSKTYMPPYLGLDFVRIALTISVIILALSWTAPALADNLPAAASAWQQLKQPLRNFRNTLDNAFASLRSSVGIVSDYYGPTLALGRGNRLSDNLIFNVLVPSEVPPGTRYYWRARVYDIYENGWTSTLKTTEALPAENFDLDFPDMEDNATGFFSFAFSLGSPLATLFTTGQPVWLSRPTQAELAVNPDGSVDLGSLRATPALRAGELYNLRSSLNAVTISDLREAGTDYPVWVTNRYLQLPDSVTERTRLLAEQIAQGNDNPYDITLAITNYLRSNIEYVESVPSLPNDQDLVDWFLFDVRQGFCNYYASAEVVMLRSLGIPARLAVGYAQGESQEINNVYAVRQRDAHAWPEVYFPGTGWVEFEPTTAQPVLFRPLGESPDSSALDAGLTDEERTYPQPLSGLPEDIGADVPDQSGTVGNTSVYYLIVTVLLVTLAVLLAGLISRRQIQQRLIELPILLERGFRRAGFQPPSFVAELAHRARLTPLQRSYHELNLALRRLGSPPNPDETPAERADHLGNQLPPAQPPAQSLVAEYHSATYSPSHHADTDLARMAGAEIRVLSYKAWLRRLFTEPSESPSRRRR